MAIKNVTRSTLIASSSRIADSVLKRAVGLMISRPTEAAMVLMFPKETGISLHTFFVFFPIDILFVDADNRIAELLKQMPPFSTYSAKQKAKLVIELPAGSISKSKTRVGDSIAFLKVVEKKLHNGRSITVSKV